MKALLALLASLSASLLITELGLRALGYAPPEPLSEFHTTLGWANRPDAELRRKTPEFDVHIRLNALGLRDDPELVPAAARGAARGVVLGDSFVLGHSVDREDLFVDRLEAAWRRAGREVELVNAGTEGWSTDQAVVWLQENGRAWRPDFVLLFPYENDLYWNSQTRYGRYPKPRFRPNGSLETGVLPEPEPRSWLSRTALANLPLLPRGTPHETFRPGTREILREHGPLLETPPEFVGDAVARTRGALLALRRECEALGADLLIVPIPSHSAVDPVFAREVMAPRLGLEGVAWSAGRPVEVFLGLAEEVGIASLDVRPGLEARALAGDPLYFDLDWHLDPSGNRALAELVSRELDHRGVPAP